MSSRDELMERRKRLSPEQRARLEQRLRGEAAPRAAEPTIPRRAGNGPAPLSFAQQRLFVIQQLEGQSPIYNVAARLSIRGPLNVEVLRRAVEEISRRHEVLRTRFLQRGGEPVQEVLADARPVFQRVDLGAVPPAEREARLEELSRREATHPFDLEHGPLLRVTVVRLGAEEHALCFVVHHIVWDGWSNGILLRELSALYQAFLRGEPSPLPVLPIQYADFTLWQRAHLSGAVLEGHLEYWRKQLQGAPAQLELPTDRPRTQASSAAGAAEPFALPAPLTAALKRLAVAENTSLFAVMLAAFQALLGRYSGQDDVLVGTAVANRREELEGLIGFFSNTVVLRGRLSGDPSFRELVSRARQVVLDAQAHQDLPFDRLVTELRKERGASGSPLLQVFFGLQAAAETSLGDGLRIGQVEEIHTATRAFELSLLAHESPDGVSGILEYGTDLFDADTIRRMLGHYLALLRAAVERPELPFSALPLLSAEEHAWFLARNATERPYGDECLHALVERQAARAPDAVAVVFEGQTLTYGELDRRANRLARALRELGVGPDARVALCLERSLELPVALLGTMKAGGACVPLEPGYPRDRLQQMLEDAEPRVLVLQRHLEDRLPPNGLPTVYLEPGWGTGAGDEATPPLPVVDPDNLAYVLFTSGSTGRPKGVQIPHRGLSSQMRWMEEVFTLGPADAGLVKGSLSFAPTVCELFAPLAAGGRVVLAHPTRGQDAPSLCQLIAEQGVTTVEMVPSLLDVVLNDPASAACQSLRHVFSGGEALTRALERRFHERWPHARLHNLYGPTEASSAVTWWPSTPADEGARATVPVGRALANATVYVLDSRMEPTPLGVVGEIYAGGPVLTRGYIRAPAETARRFIPDPFSRTPGGRLYRTGDLGRYLPDGTVEYVGRADHQVKIRGVRIEMGEVEAALRRLPAVHDAVVVAWNRGERPDDLHLVAYVVPAPGANASAAELRRLLGAVLPEHTIPGYFVVMDALPLTPNGKVDRRALPPPAAEPAREQAVPPATPMERTVLALWEEVLGVTGTGVEQGFFDVGGHSLRATALLARLREQLGVEVSLRTFFDAPTVRALSRHLEQARASGKSSPPPPRPVPRDRPLPLSFPQEAVWRSERDNPLGNCIAAYARLRGPLDVEVLRRALEEIVRRHESLRVLVDASGPEPVQRIAPPAAFELPVVDLGPLPPAEREAEAARRASAMRASTFDLTRAPLLRGELVRLGAEEHHLLLTVHRLAFDGSTLALLVGELGVLYEAFLAGRPSPLPPLPLQYPDFALWQRKHLGGTALEQALARDRARLTGARLVRLPTDRPRPEHPSPGGDARLIRMPGTLTAGLQALGAREGVSLYATLLTGFLTLLHHETGETDLCVASPDADRPYRELEGLLGRFANVLVVRASLEGDPTFLEALRRVNAAVAEAQENGRHTPHHRLAEALYPGERSTETPLEAITFNYLSQFERPLDELRFGGLLIEPFPPAEARSKSELTLNLEGSAQALTADLLYRTDLFTEQTILRLLHRYQTVLGNALARPGARLSELRAT
ncbi:amino acid adenylation domain-containing protein [Archangium violaceum]|uniref:amino acid adenylation domain-containing protein n=1 Tax=Archangium violaceum TaxID=83451 RepID=UPI0036DF002E